MSQQATLTDEIQNHPARVTHTSWPAPNLEGKSLAGEKNVLCAAGEVGVTASGRDGRVFISFMGG